jgi:hypothetical protein
MQSKISIKFNKFLIWIFCSFFQALVGCSINTGVVKLDKDRYIVTKQAPTGFSGMGTLTLDALKEANDFCSFKRLITSVEKIEESKPPYVAGNFPRCTIIFECLERTVTYQSLQPIRSNANMDRQNKRCNDLGFDSGTEMFKTCLEKLSNIGSQ